MPSERRRPASVASIVVAALLVLGWPVGAAASGATENRPGPYFTAPFSVVPNAQTFGQDPSWTPRGQVLSDEDDPTGVEQVYVSDLDGAAAHCLTCGQPGPNGFAQERPEGDWILFCSWRGEPVTFGKPCLGGVGSDLYAMRADGSEVTRLTGPGTALEPAGVAFDNYHPSWSPDGREIVWTHVAFGEPNPGSTQWTILLADFTARGAEPPRLSHVRVVAPAGDTAYETQTWAPDGSGFLYTGVGEDGAGWMNLELYFERLSGHGASVDHPVVSHLTDDSPAWDEQAVFTPDMRDVIWMSSRGSPSWYQTVVTAAQQVGFNPPLQNDTFGPMFELTIADPEFHTDLYELDLASHAVRRLTYLDRIVPEFYFDPTGRQLLWSEGGGGGTTVGEFHVSGAPPRVGPRVALVRSASRPRSPTVVLPPGTLDTTRSSGPLPVAVVTGATLLETQLEALAAQLHGLPNGASCCRAPG